MDEYLNKKNSLENNIGKYIKKLNSIVLRSDEFNNHINKINELIKINNNIGIQLNQYLKNENIIKFLNKDKFSKNFLSIIRIIRYFLINNIFSKINYIKDLKEEKNDIIYYDNNKII